MSSSRLKDKDITLIVAELERWRDGQLGSKLTWSILEKNFGYTRQSLESHIRIKSAYQAAKITLRKGLTQTRQQYIDEVSLLKANLETMKSLVKDYEQKEREWQMRWQRIAYHVRAKGLNFVEIDRSINSIPSEKVVKKIIEIFDQPLPPNGRT